MAVDKVLNFTKSDSELFIEIEIVDDEGWEPDEDFFVDLYDANGN